jgi:GT2 family glycosyltransferase
VNTLDVVVVSYNSRRCLRRCVEPLSALEGVNVFVVDNASADGSLDTVAGLPVETLALSRNGGFAHGCNVGWRAGRAPFVLFLNPDAEIDATSLRTLTSALATDDEAGAIAPTIVTRDGTLDFSQRRFPRLRSTYAQALYLHRLFPRRAWTDELVRDPGAYEVPGSPEWVSGACILVKRAALERIDGWDEGFFHYCEDIDLCRRLWDGGYAVRYEPRAIAVHEGGASAPRPTLLPVLAASRARYARKHRSRPVALLERIGIALGALTHLVAARGGVPTRIGHARSLYRAVRPARA